MINIVIPMAGRGSRFAGTENDVPKPLIEVVPGKAMVDLVIDYLRLPEQHRFIFVGLAAHDRAYRLKEFFRDKTSGHEVVLAHEVTAGPAVSALLAETFIDNEDELLVAYCDMFLTINMTHFLEWNRRNGSHGGVVTYPSTDAVDSYAQIDSSGRVARTAEKVVISGTATAGVYYFRKGQDFVSSVHTMLATRPDGDSELFVNPCYNELIRQGKTVLAYPISRDARIEMGTPDDLRRTRLWFIHQSPPFMGQATI
jgi:NDP-sugar pyrophosphorylase family protein